MYEFKIQRVYCSNLPALSNAGVILSLLCVLSEKKTKMYKFKLLTVYIKKI